jgi:hypothetical protein
VGISGTGITSFLQNTVQVGPEYYQSVLRAVILNSGIPTRNYFTSLISVAGFLPLWILIFSFGLALILISNLMWLVERKKNEEFLHSYEGVLDGAWWGLVTAWTIGYGDKVPKSRTGYFLGIVWFAVSFVFVLLLSSTITSKLVVGQTPANIMPEDLR